MFRNGFRQFNSLSIELDITREIATSYNVMRKSGLRMRAIYFQLILKDYKKFVVFLMIFNALELAGLIDRYVIIDIGFCNLHLVYQ